MHLIFVRHGDPDYKNDSLTQKGILEAELLEERVREWKIDKAYCSPMGRAKLTSEIALKNKNITPEIKPWLREFNYPIDDPDSKNKMAWDWLPRVYMGQEKYFDRKDWYNSAAMKSGDIGGHYKEVCSGVDEILREYGYSRKSEDDFLYTCRPHLTAEEAAIDTHLDQEQKDLDPKNIVFFCHLGVMFAIISHFTGVSPVQLWQGFFVAPTSVTVLGAEERVPGEVIFRVQTFGDCTHLLSNNEIPSASGFFGNCFVK